MKKLKKIIISHLVLVFLCIIFISHAYASELTEIDDLVIEGQKEFQQSCAVCHGADGKGDGPYSIALVFKPADLTKLLIKNEGHFPFLETYLIIDGRDMLKQHGTRLMPIWGDRYSQEAWSAVSPEYSNTLIRGRIFELLLYLYSIQESEL